MDSYICCGMQYGDEGKGSFIDWLTYRANAECIIKYNGGSQASHTVQTPDKAVHKFAQLGSGMFKDGVHTYITKNMVVNPDNLIREIQAFSRETGEDYDDIKKRVHIHEECLIVTPYHKLLNQLRELSLGNNRRGSVGTGVSEVPVLWDIKLGVNDNGIGMKMKDLYCKNAYVIIGKLEDLQNYVRGFYRKYENDIWMNCPDELKDGLEEQVKIMLEDNKAFMRIGTIMFEKHCNALKGQSLEGCLYNHYEDTIRKHKTVIWEGSQGLLLDKANGIYPNTTMLNTTLFPALELSYYLDNITRIGIIKSFCSRHGSGAFPTEDKELSNYIHDKNQDVSFWNGAPRYGWFDSILYRYANDISQVNQAFLSGLDLLSGLEKVKICDYYFYNGTDTSEEFKETFNAQPNDGRIKILGINQNHPKLKEWLSECEPHYNEYEGWGDIKEAKTMQDLPKACRKFIDAVNIHISTPITVVSVGPTRNNKIVLDGSWWS